MASGNSLPVTTGEKRTRRFPGKVPLQVGADGLAKKDTVLSVAFCVLELDLSSSKVNAAEVKRSGRPDTDARGEHQMEEGMVALALRAFRLGEHCQEQLLLIVAHSPRRCGSAKGPADELTGIMWDVAGTMAVAKEGLER